MAQTVTVVLSYLLVSTPDDCFYALGQACPVPVQNLLACDETGRTHWDLKYPDTSTPRLPWGLKPMVVLMFQLLGLCSEGRGQCAVHGECSAMHSLGASLLLVLPSPHCQGPTIGLFSSEGSLKEWGWGKPEPEVGRVSSWWLYPDLGRALEVAEHIILQPHSSPWSQCWGLGP